MNLSTLLYAFHFVNILNAYINFYKFTCIQNFAKLKIFSVEKKKKIYYYEMRFFVNQYKTR